MELNSCSEGMIKWYLVMPTYLMGRQVLSPEDTDIHLPLIECNFSAFPLLAILPFREGLSALMSRRRMMENQHFSTGRLRYT